MPHHFTSGENKPPILMCNVVVEYAEALDMKQSTIIKEKKLNIYSLRS